MKWMILKENVNNESDSRRTRKNFNQHLAMKRIEQTLQKSTLPQKGTRTFILEVFVEIPSQEENPKAQKAVIAVTRHDILL